MVCKMLDREGPVTEALPLSLCVCRVIYLIASCGESTSIPKALPTA